MGEDNGGTGIDVGILLGNVSLGSASIAKRMSWAAHHRTTKPEDLAYCIMGIFSVNIPLLYGEGGERAFLGLQEKIMKQSDDHSLFAWLDLQSDPASHYGLLAKSPANFALSNAILPYYNWEPRAPYSTSNRGQRIDLHLKVRQDGLIVAALNCPAPPDYEEGCVLAIYLQKITDSDEQYARVRVGKYACVTERGARRTIYVRQTPKPGPETGVFHSILIQLATTSAPRDYRLRDILTTDMSQAMYKKDAREGLLTSCSAQVWVPSRFSFVYKLLRQSRQLAVALIFERGDGERLALLMGCCDGSSFDIGFDAKELSSASKASYNSINSGINIISSRDDTRGVFESLNARFEPSLAGRFDLEHHSVRMSASPITDGASKYYMVTIGMESVKSDLKVLKCVHAKYKVVSDAAHASKRHMAQEEEGPDRQKRASRWRRLVGREDRIGKLENDEGHQVVN